MLAATAVIICPRPFFTVVISLLVITKALGCTSYLVVSQLFHSIKRGLLGITAVTSEEGAGGGLNVC